MIYLRFGTLLKLFQEHYDESLVVFSKRLNMAPTTVSSYIRGNRFPGKDISKDMSSVRHSLNIFLAHSLNELNISSNIDIDSYIKNILNIENNLRKITEVNTKAFRKTSTKLMLYYMKKYPSYIKSEDRVNPTKIIDLIFNKDQKDEFYKTLLAMYLAGENFQNLFFEIEKKENHNYLAEHNFSGSINGAINFCENYGCLLSWEISMDVLMSLPSMISFSINCENEYKININVSTNKEAADTSILSTEDKFI